MSSENVKNQRKEETVTSVSDLPPTKRYIFTHNAEGKSVIHSSPPLQYNPIPKTGGAARSCKYSLLLFSPHINTNLPPSLHPSIPIIRLITARTCTNKQTDAISNVPVKLSNDADINAYFALTGPTSFASRDIVIPTLQGSNLALVDLLPGQSSHFHRTVSIDYSICVMGSVECELDSGEKVTLKPGVCMGFFFLIFPTLPPPFFFNASIYSSFLFLCTISLPSFARQ